ncbi:MAG: 2-C-methyl-D-erythritol 2,4-cyclodiphosphate synthase [Clostridia bacterium]|nr:2-C-methyl-D-erythritol 2,4-cyclodiphosphate synthase [Clostridia bacterium]
MNWYAIVLAGGSGSRMGLDRNKVLLSLEGITVIRRSVMAMLPHVKKAVVVVREADREAIMADLHDLQDRILYAPGGDDRQGSVANGLAALPDDCTHVLVHDGARCMVDEGTITRAMRCAEEHGSGIASVAVTDTLKEINPDMTAACTLDRSKLRAMQTPQAFRLDLLKKAHAIADEGGYRGTDDASLLEYAGMPVYMSEGSRNNMKLTTKEDIAMANALLHPNMPILRVGQGYDVHRLVEGRKLILCGVDVPHTLGLLGHSDADVALHALMDAMLGAAALGDIGKHFPDTDDRYKGISSMKLLEHVVALLRDKGWTVANCDVTMVAQKPKLLPYIPQMRQNVADALGIDLDCVNIKATTTEKLGFEGQQEGISAQAVCLLMKN